tara:strand:+ start:83 stop:364 length:282 start_codon:yes stop_codon:yes gene_type:complete
MKKTKKHGKPRRGYKCSLLLKTNVITMKNQPSTNSSNQSDDYVKRSQAEMQRRFVDLQFKRSELEKQLKLVNEVLFSLGREMEHHFSNHELYK